MGLTQVSWPLLHTTIVHRIHQFKQERPYLRHRYYKCLNSDESDSQWLPAEPCLYQVCNTASGKHYTPCFIQQNLNKYAYWYYFFQILCCGVVLCINICGTVVLIPLKGIIRRIISWTCEIENAYSGTCEKLINKRKEVPECQGPNKYI